MFSGTRGHGTLVRLTQTRSLSAMWSRAWTLLGHREGVGQRRCKSRAGRGFASAGLHQGRDAFELEAPFTNPRCAALGSRVVSRLSCWARCPRAMRRANRLVRAAQPHCIGRAMVFHPCGIQGAWLVDPTPHVDSRGRFMRAWCQHEFSNQGIDFTPVQANMGLSLRKGRSAGCTIRRSRRLRPNSFVARAG